jgi:predicted lipid-binding transport protein (Tim44 family)
MSETTPATPSEPRARKTSSDAAEPKAETKKSSATRKSPASPAKATAARSAAPKAAPAKSESAREPVADAERAMAKAEQIVDQLGYKIGRWATRAVARTREEAEDILAEAQHLRNNGRA